MQAPLIYWYRQDLRSVDLPALTAAAASGRPVIPCYILDEEAAGEWRSGGASRWWLHHSLRALADDLSAQGGTLVLRRGDTVEEIQRLLQETGADGVFCSRQYEPWARRLEGRLHEALGARGATIRRYRGSLLFEPGEVMNRSGGPFKVFTPFWRFCRNAPSPPMPGSDSPSPVWHTEPPPGDALEDWGLLPQQPDWAAGWSGLWQPGTGGARRRLARFLEEGIADYSEGRNHPARESTSRLSAHLHFGEISPREVWHTAQGCVAGRGALAGHLDKFLSELGWREFSHHLLYHFPDIPEQAFKAPFREFPWLANPTGLRAWQRGQTGYPMVDAGMRELWQTGHMHNRVRMVVASFLTKHLLVHWREGAKWFWDTLVDADLANNSCGWQWVAGSGADAAPYFRIFNPMTQGEKFDVGGDYIRRWVPELSALPDRHLNCPWDAPADLLDSLGVEPGLTYPRPVVEHRAARESALAAYASIRS